MSELIESHQSRIIDLTKEVAQSPYPDNDASTLALKEAEYGHLSHISRALTSDFAHRFPINTTGIYRVDPWQNTYQEATLEYLDQLARERAKGIATMISDIEQMTLVSISATREAMAQHYTAADILSTALDHRYNTNRVLNAHDKVIGGSGTATAALNLITSTMYRDLERIGAAAHIASAFNNSSELIYTFAGLNASTIDNVLATIRVNRQALNRAYEGIIPGFLKYTLDPNTGYIFMLSDKAQVALAKKIELDQAVKKAGKPYETIGCPFAYGTIPLLIRRTYTGLKLMFN